jgi:hypothetical protein
MALAIYRHPIKRGPLKMDGTVHCYQTGRAIHAEPPWPAEIDAGEVTVYRAADFQGPAGTVGGLSAAHAAISMDLTVSITFFPC